MCFRNLLELIGVILVILIMLELLVIMDVATKIMLSIMIALPLYCTIFFIDETCNKNKSEK